MFTLVGYSESQDTAVLANIAALADPHVRVVGDDVIVPAEVNKLMGYYFVGADITQGQLASPSLRRLYNLDVEPLDRAAEPSSPAPFHDLFNNPIELDAEEALNALMAEDNAAAGRVTALVWLGDGRVDVPAGEIFSIRVTNTTTLTAYSWTNGALTFSQTLPAGEYAIVGARFQSAGLLAFRFVLPGYSWRPGAIGFDADGDLDVARFRFGRAGEWGRFKHNSPPTVDFLSVSADSSQVGHLDLIKVA